MSLPPAPIFDALTTINKKSLDVPGGAPVKVTSLMWMQWFQQLCDYITSIGGGGGGTPASDATVLSFMEQGYEGAVSELEKKLHSLETLIHMEGYEGAVSELEKKLHSLETLIHMGGD